MPGIAGAVDGLRLASQHRVLDDRRQRRAPDTLDDAAKQAGSDSLAPGQANVERGENLAQLVELLGRRRVVDPEDAATPRRPQRFRRGDVGGDHELLDQAVAVERPAQADGRDGAVGGEIDPALGKIEVDGAARLTRRPENPIGAVERRDHARWRWRLVVGAVVAVDRALNLVVGQPRRRSHHRANELVAQQAAVPVDPQMRGDTRPVLAGIE